MEDMVAALEPLAPQGAVVAEEDDDDEDEFSEDDEPDEIDGQLSRPAAAAGAGGAAQCRQVQPVQPAAGRGTLAGGAGSRADARFHHRALEAPATAMCCCTTPRACARRRGWRARRWRKCSVASTLEAIRFADCVIVMIDATAPFEKQDLTIADLIAREGRAIVFAVNKWDLLENKAGAISAGCARSWTGCCRRWRARR